MPAKRQVKSSKEARSFAVFYTGGSELVVGPTAAAALETFLAARPGADVLAVVDRAAMFLPSDITTPVAIMVMSLRTSENPA